MVLPAVGTPEMLGTGAAEGTPGSDARGGAEAVGLEAAGLGTAALEPVGLEPAGLDTVGLETVGLEPAGLETAGLEGGRLAEVADGVEITDGTGDASVPPPAHPASARLSAAPSAHSHPGTPGRGRSPPPARPEPGCGPSFEPDGVTWEP